jgi:hypothetical protein
MLSIGNSLKRGAERMTTENRWTPEEEAFERLLDEKQGMLSEHALALVGTAHDEAYAKFLVKSHCYQPEEYVEAMEKMLGLAVELTDHEREVLAEISFAALNAAASIDPDDKTPAGGHRVLMVDVHWYYWTISDMIGHTLQKETEVERQREITKLRKDLAEWYYRNS